MSNLENSENEAMVTVKDVSSDFDDVQIWSPVKVLKNDFFYFPSMKSRIPNMFLYTNFQILCHQQGSYANFSSPVYPPILPYINPPIVLYRYSASLSFQQSYEFPFHNHTIHIKILMRIIFGKHGVNVVVFY